MQFIIFLVIAVLPILGFVIGVRMGGAGRGPQRPTGAEKQELVRRREFMDDLSGEAAEHIALGDNYAAIVMDHLQEFRRKSRELGS